MKFGSTAVSYLWASNLILFEFLSQCFNADFLFYLVGFVLLVLLLTNIYQTSQRTCDTISIQIMCSIIMFIIISPLICIVCVMLIFYDPQEIVYDVEPAEQNPKSKWIFFPAYLSLMCKNQNLLNFFNNILSTRTTLIFSLHSSCSHFGASKASWRSECSWKLSSNDEFNTANKFNTNFKYWQHLCCNQCTEWTNKWNLNKIESISKLKLHDNKW